MLPLPFTSYPRCPKCDSDEVRMRWVRDLLHYLFPLLLPAAGWFKMTCRRCRYQWAMREKLDCKHTNQQQGGR